MNLPPVNLPPADDEGSTDSTALSEPEARVSGPRIDRKELDEVFGDVFPDTTEDERDSGESIGERNQEWYQENRPPHHGG